MDERHLAIKLACLNAAATVLAAKTFSDGPELNGTAQAEAVVDLAGKIYEAWWKNTPSMSSNGRHHPAKTDGRLIRDSRS